MSALIDPAWRQTERPDDEPEPHDPTAEIACEACQLPTLLDDLYMDDRARLLCRSCWFRSFELQPLGGDA